MSAIKKGKHVVLTGPVGIGKPAVLRAALKRIEPRPSEWRQFDPVAVDAGAPEAEPEALDETGAPPGRRDRVLVYLTEHQAKDRSLRQQSERSAMGQLADADHLPTG